jgi:biopolymer transport protein ExbB
MPISTKLLLSVFAFVLIAVFLCCGANQLPAAVSTDESGGISSASGGDAEPVEGEGEPASGEVEELTLWKIITLGGKLMYLLAFLSFLTIILITFYFLSLSPANAAPPLFAQKLHEMISNRRVSEAKMFCEQNDNILSRVVRKGLANTDKGHGAVMEAMHNEGSRQSSGLWQRISYLADIAVVAPMVGLLGTTVGMMHTFMDMRSSIAIGGVKPAGMAGGIFEAMVTTVAGLIIAIIATGFYAYFRGVVQRIVITLEEISTEYGDLIVEALKKGGTKE